MFVTKRGNFLALRARLYMEAEALQEKTKKTLRAFYKFCFWSFGKDKAPQKSQKFCSRLYGERVRWGLLKSNFVIDILCFLCLLKLFCHLWSVQLIIWKASKGIRGCLNVLDLPFHLIIPRVHIYVRRESYLFPQKCIKRHQFFRRQSRCNFSGKHW